MLRSRSSFLGMLLISSVFATACGPQPETDEATPAADGQVSAMACTGNEPNLHYVSHDTTECLTLNYVCPQGERQFFNDCGCGCR
jgi:hypothetical protein